MRRTTAVLLVLLAGLLAGCGGHTYAGLGDLPLPGGVDVGPSPLTITVEFRDVLNLARGATVKVDDVTVGEVTGVDRTGWRAEVTLTVRNDVRLPANTTAAVRQTGLLGEKYVELAAPSGDAARGRLQDGQRIGLDRTTRSTEVEEVLASLSLLLNGGGLENVRTITVELRQALDGNERSIRSLFGNVDTFTRTLAANRSSIDRALRGLDTFADRLAKGASVVDRTLDRLPAAVGVLADQRHGLTRAMTALDRLSDVGTRTIRRVRVDLLADLRALAPTLRRLADAGDDIPRSLQFLLTYPFPDSAMSSVKGDYVNFAAQYALRVSDLVKLFRGAGLGRLAGLQRGDTR